MYVRLYLCNAFSVYSYLESYSDQPFLCYDNHVLRLSAPFLHNSTFFFFFFFVTNAIIQSSTSSEMCPLLKSLTSVMDNSCRSRDSNPQPRVTSLTLYPLGHGCPLLPSSHQEIWKAIFTYNFWTIWPKITRIVSLHSEQHAELNSTQFCQTFLGVCHFLLLPKMLQFTNTLANHYETCYVFSRP